MIKHFLLTLFFMISCVPVEQTKQVKFEEKSAGAESLKTVRVNNLSDVSGESNTLTWSWSCDSEEPCLYRYSIDRNPRGTPSGDFDFTNIGKVLNGQGTFYIHVQAKNMEGVLSEVVHAKGELLNLTPILQGVSDDFVVRKSKFWSWSCRYVSCRYRYYVTSSPSFSFSNQSFTTQTWFNLANVTGTYYLYLQAQNIENNAVSSVTRVQVTLDNVPPTLLGLSNDSSTRAVKNWKWECSNEVCDYRFAINQIPIYSPITDYSPLNSVTLSGVNGRYYIHVQARDASGNESAVGHYYVDMDSAIPEILNLENDTSLRKEKLWDWSCSEASCSYRFSINQSPTYEFPEDQGYVPTSSASVSGVNGVYYLHVQAKNNLTNKVGDIQTVFVNLDNNIPVISYTKGDDLSAQLEKEYEWFCSGGEFCDYRYLISEDPNAVPTGNYNQVKSIKFSGSSGTKYIAVQGRDLAGNESEVTRRTFVIATALPRPLNIFNDFSPKRIKSWSWICNLTNCEYRYAITQSPSHTFSSSIPFSTTNLVNVNEGTGTYYIHIQAKDVVNNVIGEIFSYSFILDNTAPIITIGANDEIVKSEKVWTWECEDSFCETRYAVDTNPEVNSQTQWLPWVSDREVVVSDLTGQYYIHIQARDSLLNESVPITRSFELYNLEPEITGLDEVDPNVAVPSISFTWECSGLNCVYRNVITDNADFAFTSQTFNNITQVSRSDGNDVFYLYVQAKDLISNKVGPVKKVQFLLNSVKPAAVGISEQLVPVQSSNLAWNCGANDCTYRFKIDQDPNITNLNDEEFSETNSYSVVGLNGIYFFYIQARNKNTFVVGDIIKYKMVFDNTPPIAISPTLVNSFTPVTTKTWKWSCDDTGVTNQISKYEFENSGLDILGVQDLSLSGGPTYNATSLIGDYSLYLPGTVDARATIASNSTLLANTSKTFTFWIKGDGTWESDGLSEGLARGDAAILSTNSSRMIISASSSTGKLRVNLNDDQGLSILELTGLNDIITDGEWHHVAFTTGTQSGAAATLYIDGEVNATGFLSSSWSLDQNGDDLIIGDSNDIFWEEFLGYMDNLVVINKSLNYQEIGSFYFNDRYECKSRFIVDTKSLTELAGGYIDDKTVTQSTGSSLYYIHLQVQDKASNASSTFDYYQQIDNRNPTIIGISDDLSPTNLKGFSWTCSTGNCSYRFLINTSPTHTFAIDDPYIQQTSTNYSQGNGTFYIHIQAKDNFTDLESLNVESFQFTMDTTPPAVTGLVNDINVQANKNWNWGCNEASCLYSFIISTNASDPVDQNFDNTESTFIEGVTGTYYLTVVARDIAGNTSDPFQVSVVLDQTIPQVIGIQDELFPRENMEWIWSCDAEDVTDCEYRYEISNSSTPALDDDPWGDTSTITQASGDGVFYLHVQVRKKSNLAIGGVRTVSVTLDNTPPVVNGIPADSGVAQSIIWNWNCTDTTTCNYRFLVDQNPTTVDLSSKVFSPNNEYEFTEIFGDYYIHVQAVDELGNESAVVHGKVTMENRVPVVSIVVAPVTATTQNVNDASFVWNCDIENTVPCDFRYEISTSETPALDDDPWGSVVQTQKLDGDGEFYIHVQGRNSLNNNVGEVSTLSFFMDTTPPTFTGSDLVDDPAVKTSKTWNWGCDLGAGDDGTICIMRYAFDQSPTTDGTTSWSTYSDTNTTYTASALTGRYYLHVQTQDELGNESAVTSVYVDLDNSAPTLLGLDNDTVPKNSKTWNFSCDPSSGPGDCEYRFVVDTNPVTDISALPYGTTNTATQASGDTTYYIHVQARKPVNGLESVVIHASAILDNTAPSININSESLDEPLDGSTSLDITPIISGTLDSAAEDGGSIRIYNDAACTDPMIGEGSISTNTFLVNNITFNTDGSDDGLQSFYAVVVDQAGNTNVCTNLNLSYTLVTSPTLSSLSKEAGLEGESITLTGNNFDASGNSVTVDGQACTVTFENSTTITCTLPTPSGGAGAIDTVDVVVTNSYSNSSTLSGAFTYLGTTAQGFKLWLDGSDLAVLFQTSDCTTTAATLDTDPVQCWKDKSGSGNNVIQLTTPPQLDLAAHNSLNAILFDGVDDFLEKLTATDFSFVTGEYTYFVVAAYDGTQSGYGSPLNTTGADGDKGIALFANQVTGKWEDWAYTPGPNNNSGIVGNATAGPQVITVANKLSDERVYAINGTEVAQSPLAGSFINNSLLRIGNGNNQFFKGHILEVILYRKKLTSSERSVVNTYLNTKWGITP